MVDETAFRAARNASTSPPCVFAKAVLAGCASCATSVRRALAERETIGCTSPVARTNCATFAALLRERAAFALKLTAGAPLPHAAAMKLQCGGLAGLRACAGGVEADVHRLVAGEMARRQSLADLPWPSIVASVAGWRGRRPRRARDES